MEVTRFYIKTYIWEDNTGRHGYAVVSNPFSRHKRTVQMEGWNCEDLHFVLTRSVREAGHMVFPQHTILIHSERVDMDDTKKAQLNDAVHAFTLDGWVIDTVERQDRMLGITT